MEALQMFTSRLQTKNLLRPGIFLQNSSER